MYSANVYTSPFDGKSKSERRVKSTDATNFWDLILRAGINDLLNRTLLLNP